MVVYTVVFTPSPKTLTWSVPGLLLKQILKRCPRIVRPQTGRRRSLFLPRHANLKQRTLIPLILLRNSFLHRLHALEPAPRIEISTLLARVQLKPALGTLPRTRHSLQHRAALRTPRNRVRSRQIDRPRTKCIVPFRRRRPGLLSGPLARLLIAVLIPMLTVFRCHKASPPRARIVSPTCHPLQASVNSGTKLSSPPLV
jgi:hypothetical protein